MNEPPTTIDEIPWDDPAGTPTSEIHVATPRKCRHPRDRREKEIDPDSSVDTVERRVVEKCGLCGHVFDPAMQRRGRAVRKYGHAAEAKTAERLGLERRGRTFDPEDAGGAADPAVLQSKTGPAFAPVAWIRELDALELVARNRPRILHASSKPGRGGRIRRIVVMYEDEFVRLTGLDSRRKNLEIVAEWAAQLGDALAAHEAYSESPAPWELAGTLPDLGEIEARLRASLEQLAETPAR